MKKIFLISFIALLTFSSCTQKEEKISEMPAHVMSAIAAYPELSCSHEQIEVPSGSVWPITEIYCAGNEEVFTFNKNILLEIMELFPSKYIHIGGDEATKTNWKTCPKCQKRIKDEKLADVKELQSYFIRRIEKFILSKDRLLIGWDEILEGGLAPEATVMSWRGMQGGIEAAKAGHNVIMTPGSHCYFDHYQGNPKTEPLAIGGYTSLKKVYSFKPIPEELSDKKAIVELYNEQLNTEIRYTLDGSEPNSESLLYIDLLLIEKETTIKAIVFKNGKQLEGITEKVVNPNDISKK